MSLREPSFREGIYVISYLEIAQGIDVRPLGGREQVADLRKSQTIAARGEYRVARGREVVRLQPAAGVEKTQRLAGGVGDAHGLAILCTGREKYAVVHIGN